MKTKRRAIAVATVMLMVTPFFGVMADTGAKSHKVVLKNLTVDSVDADAKTIAAHSESTSYTIDVSKATIRRASGEKAPLSGLLEFLPNDSITVWGKTADETNINASKVKNNSTRKTKGLYLATIVNIFPAGDMGLPGGDIQGTLLMIKKDNQISAVLTYGYTKFWFGKTRIAYADLKEGDVVTIQGISRSITDSTPFDLIYNTTQVKVRKHGTVPSYVLPTSFE